MAIFLGEADLATLFAQGVVTPGDCVDAVDSALREHGAERVDILPRRIVWADAHDHAPRARALKLGAAYMQDSHVMGASIYAVHYTPGSVNMWLTVFSGQTGEMLGVIHSKQVSVWKTAATAAVAARLLARPDARRMALIGTGGYAMEQLAFMAAVRDLDAIHCYSRDRQALQDFCLRASRQLGREVLPAASVRAAVEAADIVTTITTSPTPVLEGAWLPAGVHCNVMGQHAPSTREVDSAAVQGAHLIVDAMAQAMEEKGEILIPLAEGAITPEHIAGELGAALCGRVPGRSSATQRTMFCSGGTAFEYMGLCRMLLERAAQAGIGKALD